MKKLAVLPLAALAFATACSEIDSPLAARNLAAVPEIGSNTSCKALLRNSTAYEISLRTDELVVGRAYGPVTMTAVGEGQTSFAFTSTAPVMGVFVFGGARGGNFYDHRLPKLQGGTFGDGGLQTPTAEQISRVSFCWNEPPDLVTEHLLVATTAAGAYDRGIERDLEETPASYQVTGTINISNPTAAEVTFSVASYLDDGDLGTQAKVGCPTHTLAPGTAAAPTRVSCTFSVAPMNASATMNNTVVSVVTVSPITSATAGTAVMVPIPWRLNRSRGEE